MTEKNNGIIRKYYDEEKIKLSNTYYIFNGKREGENKLYYTDGKPYIECNYKDDILEGEYKIYYETGQLPFICKFNNNVMII